MRKFYEFKNITSSSADLYIYGAILSEEDKWFGSSTDVILGNFKEDLDSIGNVKDLKMYINSPGGDVFAASTMVSMLNRVKEKGTTITSYVDGLSASAASFLMMVADEIKLYKNSVVMVHKPMSYAYGNANEMQKTIEALDMIEDNVMIPLYMKKAKAEENEIKQLIDDETWLSADDMLKYFDVTVLDEEKTAVASVKSNLYKNYKNTPDFIKDMLEEVKNEEEVEEQIIEEVEQAVEEQVIEETNTNEQELEKNLMKEKEINAKLNLIKSSLLLKNLKEKEI